MGPFTSWAPELGGESDLQEAPEPWKKTKQNQTRELAVELGQATSLLRADILLCSSHSASSGQWVTSRAPGMGLLGSESWLSLLLFSPSVMSDSLRPHGLKPTRFLCPWNSPGKNTGAGCHFLLQGNLPDPGIKHVSLALAGGFFTTEALGKPPGLTTLQLRDPGCLSVTLQHLRVYNGKRG